MPGLVAGESSWGHHLKKAIYEIHITNWKKHNVGRKKSFKSTMIPNNFCSDAKLRAMPMSCRWLFLSLLLLCGDTNEDTHRLTTSQVKAMLESTSSPVKALETLQSFQMLTYSVLSFLKNRSEEKGIEVKRSELNTPKTKAVEKPPAPLSAEAPQKTDGQKAAFLIAKYCEGWKAFHGSSPPITGKDSGIAKRLAKNWTEESTEKYLAAFFAMPDAYLVKAKHPLELFERDLKQIAAFAESGSFVTRRQAAQFDDHATNAVLLDKVRKGEF